MKVLYIAGWGRSGTTILDNILGSYGPVFTTGELFYLWRRGLNQGRICGCGTGLRLCRTWRDILDVAYAGRTLRPKRTAALQRRVARVRDTCRLSRAELTGEQLDYRDEMYRLYAAIHTVTGADLIVDSSKVPSGAAVLAQMPEVESYLVHMVRDPRAVAYSWMRPKDLPDVAVARTMAEHGAAESSTNWLTWNLLIESLARGRFAGRAQRIRYEDFVAAPRDMVESLLGLVGLAAEPGPFEGDASVRLNINHTVSGNPSRFRTGPVTLRADNAWQAHQPWRPRAVSTAISLPLLHRYGYTPRR
ncbi:sulfotransferase [Winogradskya humida]|uniref:sulfotransferase n=1 Tax=Winogradskya humida TaxID=113566 RepID=UPI001944666B|nr:sulfotransferase [Actinoplanes humidus]